MVVMNGGCVIDVLVVIIFVRVFNRVYSYITNFRLVVAFDFVFVVVCISFKYGFIVVIII